MIAKNGMALKAAWHLEYSARRRILYHSERASFLQKIHGALVFAFLFFGTATIADWLPDLSGLLALMAGIIDAVYGPAKRSAAHKISAFRYQEVMAHAEQLNKDTIDKQLQASFDLAMQTSPDSVHFYALEALCENRVSAHYYGEQKAPLRLSFLQRRAKNFLSFSSTIFKTSM